MKKIVVAIDGHSSCGKSTMAKALASYAGYKYVDTGAMYRAVALAASREGLLDIPNEIDLAKLEKLLATLEIDFIVTSQGQHTSLNGIDVEAEIRTLQIGNAASRVSAIPFVRTQLVSLQQDMGRAKGIVMDGRDIGTVVFPNAELKVFVTASPEVRAKRRFDELLAKGTPMSFDDVLKDVLDRDYRDTHREVSPLKQADDALLLDNSNMTREEQSALLQSWFDKRIL
ncbi:MAG: (d)CMP kinase [bacterium]|nr:(d)CMP kinase [Candidatus Minthenecus merdequi]